MHHKIILTIFALITIHHSFACADTDTPHKNYAIIIGNNQLPDPKNPDLQPLNYADDDAALVFEWAHEFMNDVHLLSMFDDATQKRYPHLVKYTRVPTVKELERSIALIKQQIVKDHAAHKEAWLYIYFSGHGDRDNGREPYLALADGRLTQAFIYERLLQELAADYAHILIDACYAEAIIRPRAIDKKAVQTKNQQDPADHLFQHSQWLQQHTLRRFPHVGAILSSSTHTESHESSFLEHGIFTYQLVSGLRGMADVNADGHIEYSEIHAFLAAASSQLTASYKPAAPLVFPPPLQLRLPIVELISDSPQGYLAEVDASLGRFQIEDSSGRPLLSGHIESHHQTHIALPTDQPLFIYKTLANHSSAYSEIMLKQKEHLSIKQLTWHTRAMDSDNKRAMAPPERAKQLFQTPFGPTYYRGFCDHQCAAPVSLNRVSYLSNTPVLTKQEMRSYWPAYALFISAGASAATAIVMGGLALHQQTLYNQAQTQREAEYARRPYESYQIAFWVSTSIALASTALGCALFPWQQWKNHSLNLAAIVTPEYFQLSFSGRY